MFKGAIKLKDDISSEGDLRFGIGLRIIWLVNWLVNKTDLNLISSPHDTRLHFPGRIFLAYRQLKARVSGTLKTDLGLLAKTAKTDLGEFGPDRQVLTLNSTAKVAATR